MIGVTIDVPAVDVANLNATLQRYAAYFKGNIPKTVEKTMVKLIVALRAANTTMRSKDRRRIVPNPGSVNQSADKRTRRAQHIAEYYAKIDGASVPLAIERLTQGKGVKYTPLPNMRKIKDAKRLAEFFYPKQYFLSKPYGKQGLAQSSWSWMLKRLGKSSTAEQAEINSAVSIDKSDRVSGGVQEYQITATNKLNYIRSALKANVSSFMYRANKMMIDEIEGHKKGAAQYSGRMEA